GLIAQAPSLGFPPQGPEDLGIDPNGDQPSSRDAQGGRPTRRMARSCAGDVSGMSEKSIPRRRIRRPLFAARPPRADDREPFAIVSPPDGIGHEEDAAGCRPAQSERSSLLPECRRSGPSRASGSPNTVAASSNETPCLLRLTAAFRVSHSTTVQYIRNSPERIGRGVEILILYRTSRWPRQSGCGAVGPSPSRSTRSSCRRLPPPSGSSAPRAYPEIVLQFSFVGLDGSSGSDR